MRNERSQKGSISIEASISLVAFTFFIVCVLLLINVSRVQMRLQTAADKAVREVTGYLYLYKVSGLYDVDISIQQSGNRSAGAINTAIQSFDQIADGVEKVADKIGGVTSAGDMKGRYQALSDTIKQGRETGNVLQEQYGTLSGLISSVSDNPIAYLRSLGAMAVSTGWNKAKSYIIGSLLAKNLTLKYLGGAEAADKMLKSYRVEKGVEGLDFSCSCIFDQNSDSANPLEDVNIVILYKMNVAPLMGKLFTQLFCVTASARGWLGGDTLIDRLANPNPKGGSSGGTNPSPAPTATPTAAPKTSPAEGGEEEPEEEEINLVPEEEEINLVPEDPPKPWSAKEAENKYLEKKKNSCAYEYAGGDYYVSGDLEGHKTFYDVRSFSSTDMTWDQFRWSIKTVYDLSPPSGVMNAEPGTTYVLTETQANEHGLHNEVEAQVNGAEWYSLTIILPPEAADDPLYGEGMKGVLEMQIANDLAADDAQRRRIMIDIQYGGDA